MLGLRGAAQGERAVNLPAVTLGAFNAERALRVLRNLDVNDAVEASILNGRFDPYEALAGFVAASPVMIRLDIAEVARPDGQRIPFAIVALSRTGFPGVAAAQMIACNHAHFRAELWALARMIRDGLPGFARDAGVRRIECRCYGRHPTAAGFLRALRFDQEGGDLKGFGPGGDVAVLQFAWTQPDDGNREETDNVPDQNAED